MILNGNKAKAGSTSIPTADEVLDTWESYDFYRDLHNLIIGGGTDGPVADFYVNGSILGVAISTSGDANNPSRVTVLTPERIDDGAHRYNLYETHMMMFDAYNDWLCILMVTVDTFENVINVSLENFANSTSVFSSTLEEWQMYSPQIYIKTS